MKLKALFILLICLDSICCFAHHIVGGEVYYVYSGKNPANNNSIYIVTLRLFRPCHPEANAAELPQVVILSVFENSGNFARVTDLKATRSSFNIYSISTYPDCISAKPQICYQVASYAVKVELPDNQVGYQIAFQTCCRATTNNVAIDPEDANSTPGATYVGVIPGTDRLPSGHNSSAVFKLKDTALICAGAKFRLDFSATDPDSQDSLSYSFTTSYDGGNITFAEENAAGLPPYHSLHYASNFNPNFPLGPKVTINPTTGVISGLAPAGGNYVIAVSVSEWRNGTVISTHRKDFIMAVTSNCKIPTADLNPTYSNCNGFVFSEANQGAPNGISSYYWDFGVPGLSNDTSNLKSPTYTYADTGTYQVTLIVDRGAKCTDTAIATVYVYPGFQPDFNVAGNCVNESYQFSDATKTNYGVVNKWQWTFLDPGSTDPDVSLIQNPSYRYFFSGTKYIQLIAGTNKGCSDTVTKALDVLSKPLLNLLSRDTLICSIDSLQILDNQPPSQLGGYDYSWSPNYNISDPTILNPLLFPKSTTTYYLTFDDHKGCSATDTITVNVIDKVSLALPPDTTVCQTDLTMLMPVTDGLRFVWSPANGLNDPFAKNPLASPATDISYLLTAYVGHCFSSASINMKVAPYPIANAGADTTLCYGFSTVLHGFMKGAFFNWSPTDQLLNGNTLDPTASPIDTLAYILTVTDTLGCPKPVHDTVVVNIFPKVRAFAGNDTSIVINQPLQLNASGGVTYSWTPGTGMNDPSINNPLILLPPYISSITYGLIVGTPEGCTGTDSITVKIFETLPDIFVPNSFTPNGDGRNDLLRPILVGMKNLTYFNIYNRWGQMVFHTSQIGQGWDGRIGGREQATSTYVFAAAGVDYQGRSIFRKGTITLIR